MSFLPLTLGVGQKSGAGSGSAKLPPHEKAEKVIERDDFACRFCGFRSTRYQRAVPFEGENVTACVFCEQVMFLERAGLMGGGVLVWLPEITQAELNHIARAIYVARSEDNAEMATAATRALDALMARRTDAKKRLGTDDPLVLATVFVENLTEGERTAAVKKLEGIRLMPLDKHMVRSHGGDINGFGQLIKFWRSAQGPFAEIPTGAWRDMFAKLAA